MIVLPEYRTGNLPSGRKQHKRYCSICGKYTYNWAMVGRHDKETMKTKPVPVCHRCLDRLHNKGVKEREVMKMDMRDMSAKMTKREMEEEFKPPVKESNVIAAIKSKLKAGKISPEKARRLIAIHRNLSSKKEDACGLSREDLAGRRKRKR